MAVTNHRHYESLFKARNALKGVLHGIDQGISGYLLAKDIPQALHYL